jgi:tRNA dimethylallyltransferase
MQLIGLTRDRQDLYTRINQRVDRMFEEGLVGEVEELVSKGMSPVARQAIGYKEVIDYLDGQYDFKAARDLLKKNTRHFAKRQLSWFRYDQRINWVNIAKDETVDQTVKKIMVFSLDRP